MARRRRFARSLGMATALVVSGAVTVALAADAVVVKVGESALSAPQFQARLARIPLYQLKSLGNSPDAIKRNLLDQVAQGMLLAEGAKADGLDQELEVRDRIRAIYVSALLERLRAEAEEAGDVSDDEVKAYYEANRERFASQKRIQIWQIVVDSMKKVEEVYAALESDDGKKDPVGTWEKLAREMSIDKTTAMRKGNIGFVQPDGSTAHKDVRVPKELYAAADAVGDGEVVDKPLKMGEYFVVIQRRGAIQTPERTLEMETKTIRGLLSKKKVSEKRKALVEDLRKKWVTELWERGVDALEITPGGELEPQARPGTLQREAIRPGGRARPKGAPGNLR